MLNNNALAVHHATAQARPSLDGLTSFCSAPRVARAAGAVSERACRSVDFLEDEPKEVVPNNGGVCLATHHAAVGRGVGSDESGSICLSQRSFRNPARFRLLAVLAGLGPGRPRQRQRSTAVRRRSLLAEATAE